MERGKPASLETADQDSAPFTDLLGEISGPRGRQAAEALLLHLDELCRRLERVRAGGLPPDEFARSETIQEALRAAGRVIHRVGVGTKEERA